MGVKVREKVTGSGVYWVFVSHNGRRTSRQVGSKKAALKVKTQIDARLTLEEEFLPEKQPTLPTVGEYYQTFRKAYLLPATRPSTQRSYESSFRVHILPTFGKLRLDQITSRKMEAFISDLVVNKKLAKHSIETIVKEVRKMFNHAKKHKLVIENPAVGLSELYRQAPTRNEDVNPLTADEVPVFLNAARDHAPGFYVLFLLAIHTGLRIGETCGLKWGDIDFNGRFLTVQRSIDRVHKKILRPKNGKNRRVDISDELLEELTLLKRHRKEEYLGKGQNTIPDWVFVDREGDWLDADVIREGPFHRVLEKAGLRHMRLHDLRHSYASLLLTAGTPIAYISEQMGHASIQLTVNLYGHLQPGANRHHLANLPGLEQPTAIANKA